MDRTIPDLIREQERLEQRLRLLTDSPALPDRARQIAETMDRLAQTSADLGQLMPW